MTAPRVDLAASSSSLPFSIENILRQNHESRTPVGCSTSAFRPVGKNGFRPVLERIASPLCVERFELDDAPNERSLTNSSHHHSDKWLDERYPHILSGKRLKSRFTEHQVTVLEHVFRSKPYIMGRERNALAKRVGLSELQVKTWFQNKRQKYRRLNTRCDAEPENERWRRADCGTPSNGSEPVKEEDSY